MPHRTSEGEYPKCWMTRLLALCADDGRGVSHLMAPSSPLLWAPRLECPMDVVGSCMGERDLVRCLGS